MRKLLCIRQILCLSVVLAWVIPMKTMAQTNDVVDVLVEMGFENVGCVEDEEERIYVLQNSAYRANGVGVAKAVDVIQKQGLSASKPCRIVLLDNNIPQLSLYYRPIVGDTVPQVVRKDWNVSYDLGDSWKKLRKIKTKNSSLFKVDVLVYPQVALKNLVINQIYQVLFHLSPAVEVSFWKGMKLTAQVKIPIYNDGYGMLEDKIHPGHLTVSQRFRLPYNVFGKLTVGYFNADQYGLDLDLMRPFKDERFSLLFRLGYTGTGYWNGFTLHYDPTMTWSWGVGAGFYWPEYNTQFSLKLEQYQMKDRGVKFEMIRQFRYCAIGFYAMKGVHSPFGYKAKTNGGFRFQILLPPYKYKRHKYIPRISTSQNMGLVYNANNEQYFYRQYKAEASDNIMEDNSFNPYFIKSEMLNY